MRLDYLARLGSISCVLLALMGTIAVRQATAGDFPAGSPVQGPVAFQYAVYYLPEPDGAPIAAVRRWAEAGNADLRFVEEIPENPTTPVVQARMVDDVGENYPPPDMETIRYFGRGLTRAQAEGLQTSRRALILNFVHPSDAALKALRAANEMVAHVAEATGGLPWDDETREIFSVEEWRSNRIGSWTGAFPDIADHIVIHSYNTGEHVRAITLGMGKFGLPDVVVQEFSWRSNDSIGNLMNLFAQAMIEGATFERPGLFDLELRAVEHPDVRQRHLDSLGSDAEAVARLTLKDGVWEDGDPRNRLIEIAFDRYPGPDVFARQDAMLSALWGSEDSVSKVNHTAELLAASERAKAKLPSLREAFNAGLEPGEFLLVKAPFATPDGRREWMWVEVSRWQGDTIVGLLSNDPYYVPDLHAGQQVTVSQRDIFDYIRHFADGSEEGNETGEIIQRMNQ